MEPWQSWTLAIFLLIGGLAYYGQEYLHIRRLIKPKISQTDASKSVPKRKRKPSQKEVSRGIAAPLVTESFGLVSTGNFKTRSHLAKQSSAKHSPKRSKTQISQPVNRNANEGKRVAQHSRSERPADSTAETESESSENEDSLRPKSSTRAPNNEGDFKTSTSRFGELKDEMEGTNGNHHKVLRLTAVSGNGQPAKQQTRRSTEVVETKKQRQNRKKRELAKWQRELDEMERQAALKFHKKDLQASRESTKPETARTPQIPNPWTVVPQPNSSSVPAGILQDKSVAMLDTADYDSRQIDMPSTAEISVDDAEMLPSLGLSSTLDDSFAAEDWSTVSKRVKSSRSSQQPTPH